MKKIVSLFLLVVMEHTSVTFSSYIVNADATTVTYTMDEGSKMRSAGFNGIEDSSYGSTKYMQVDDNYILRLPACINQFSYFRLPSDWATAAGEDFTPTTLTFNLTRGSDLTSFCFKDAYFSTEFSSGKAQGNKYQWNSTDKWPSQFPSFSKYKIDLTKVTTGTLSSYSYVSFKCKNNSSSADTEGIYIDDVTITYQREAIDYTDIAGTTNETAQLRLGSQNGIRFLTNIDADLVATAQEKGYTVTMGTLIAPLSYDILTLDSGAVNVTTPGYYKDTSGVIAASIVNIKNINISKSFVARGYVTLTKDGESTTYYSSQPDEGRSLKTLSATAVADDAFFEVLNKAQQDEITAWANAE